MEYFQSTCFLNPNWLINNLWVGKLNNNSRVRILFVKLREYRDIRFGLIFWDFCFV